MQTIKNIMDECFSQGLGDEKSLAKNGVLENLLETLRGDGNAAQFVEQLKTTGGTTQTVDDKSMLRIVDHLSGQTPPALYDPKGVLNSPDLNPIFAQKMKTLLERAWADGHHVVIIEGYRDRARQDALYKQGGVTKAKGGNSFHNYGLAADIAFLDKDGKITWDSKEDWVAVGKIGKDLGMGWGGNFKHIKDLGHFEYHPDMNLKEVKKLFQNGGRENLWGDISSYPHKSP